MRSFDVLVALLVFAAQPASAGACDHFTAGMVKLLHTPRRSVLAAKGNGKLIIGSSDVYVGDKHYSKIIGFIASVNWEIKPWLADQDEADYRAFLAKAKETCRAESTETMEDGTIAEIFVTESETDGKKTLKRTWIAQSTGLPLKIETDGTNGSVATEIFEYNDVAPPYTVSDGQGTVPADGCKRLVDASVKRFHTPNIATVKPYLMGMSGITSQTIDVGGKSYEYTKEKGWEVKPWNPDEDEAKYRKDIDDDPPDSCRIVGLDVIDAENVDIISKTTSGAIPINGWHWISRSSGALLRSDLRLHGRGGVDMRIVITYEYRDVHAPPGVN